VPVRPRPLTGNQRAFTAMVRNALFRRVEPSRAGAGTSWVYWTPTSVGPPGAEEVGLAYFAEHDDVGIGADARGPALLIVDRAPAVAGAADHRRSCRRPRLGIDVEVDLAASDEEGVAVIQLGAGRMDPRRVAGARPRLERVFVESITTWRTTGRPRRSR
jgi:hypothetical protein